MRKSGATPSSRWGCAVAGDQIGLFQDAPSEAMSGAGAVFSPCGLYRYRLWRVWDRDRAPTAFLMMNPSTAGAHDPDMTVSKCVGFGRRFGAGGVIVVNPYAYIATHPDDLVAARERGVDIVGPDNDQHLREAFGAVDCVVVATGGHPILRDAIDRVVAMIPTGVRVCCLGRTKEGRPRHPSRLAYASPRAEYFAFEVSE